MSVQATKDKHHRLFYWFQENLHIFFCFYFDSTPLKAFTGLLRQSTACHASVAGRRVVALSGPRHRSPAAGGPCAPAAPAAVDGYVCREEPRITRQYIGRLGAQIQRKQCHAVCGGDDEY